ncbi:MAG: von Willebrand factor type A domain-containing protein [Verrucomicrobiales bacterium]|jgi:Ca-activated chloride channel family protein|nr:von Willebrand factor type A domain-containing protein [Verrucomicrobiales bacterium]
MKINSEDPRLTAYALGELDPSEVDDFEKILEECPEAKSEVDAIRGAIKTIKEEFAEAPKKKLSKEQKQILFSNEEDVILDPGPGTFSKVNRWLGVTAAAACFVGMGIVGLRSVKQELQENSDGESQRVHTRAVDPTGPVPLDSKEDSKKGSIKESDLDFAEVNEKAKVKEESKFEQIKQLEKASVPSSKIAESQSADQNGPIPKRFGLSTRNAAPFASNEGDELANVAGIRRKQSSKSKPRIRTIESSAKSPLDLNLGRELQDGSDKRFFNKIKEKDGWDDAQLRDKELEEINSEQYQVYHDTPFFPTIERPLSTFAIDVDTASYSNVRRYIGRRGQLPPADAVRVEELINYFDYDYPYSGDKHPFSVHLETSSVPWKAGHRLVRIGLKAKDIQLDKRPASNLVFLIDCSGSMGNKEKLPLLKKSLVLLVENLTEDDRIGIVTYAGGAGVELDPLHGDQKDKIIEVINGLRSGGSTNGEGGIRVAYDLASKNYIEGGTNRVIIATDGDFNVGISNSNKLIELVKGRADKEKIFLTALGFGEGNIKDARLEQIANNGNGEYYYIDSIKEGRRVLVDKMSSTLVTVAKDVKIQVDFNPRKVKSYRLIGYANRRMKAEEFRDDAKDAGEIGAGHAVTALYEIVPAGSTSDEGDVAVKSKYRKPAKKAERSDIVESEELLTVFLRYKDPEADIKDEAEEFSVPLTDSGKGWENSSKDFRFASSVAGFGMLLRNSKFGGQVNYDLLLEIASEGIGKDKNGLRKEFVELVKKAKSIAQAKSTSE